MTPAPVHVSRHAQLTMAIALILWFLALYALRYGYFEISPEQDPCLRDAASNACALRSALGTTIHHQVFGLTGFFAAALAMVFRGSPRRWLGAVGLFVSAAALVLYNSRYGAPGAALSVVALVGGAPARAR